VTLRVISGGSIRMRHTARVPILDTPGAAGDNVQFLGRKARVLEVRRGVVYALNAPTTEATKLALLKSWHDAGTNLTLVTSTEASLIVRLTSLIVVEPISPTGYEFDLDAVDVGLNPSGTGGGSVIITPSGLSVSGPIVRTVVAAPVGSLLVQAGVVARTVLGAPTGSLSLASFDGSATVVTATGTLDVGASFDGSATVVAVNSATVEVT